ncbi:MAG: aminotransferase class I/II-fold pyridoxal phosphate-dependent enzyme, partial [Pseudomonadota bacterium]
MTTHPTIQPLPRILDIAPYVGGASHLDGANRTIKLSANENPFGPVEGAIEAYRDMAGELGLYPEDHGPLSTAIGTLHGIDADRIVLGNGSDELIALLCKAYAGPGDEVLFSEHGFLMYKLSA